MLSADRLDVQTCSPAAPQVPFAPSSFAAACSALAGALNRPPLDRSQMEDGKQQSASGLDFKLHPLVLVNVSDHFTRTKANQGSNAPVTVMGCLLGSQNGRTIDVSNSFEMNYSVPASGGIQVDHAFLLQKQEQYKAVFPKLDVVGWYTTGSALEERHRQVRCEQFALALPLM